MGAVSCPEGTHQSFCSHPEFIKQFLAALKRFTQAAEKKLTACFKYVASLQRRYGVLWQRVPPPSSKNTEGSSIKSAFYPLALFHKAIGTFSFHSEPPSKPWLDRICWK